MENNKQLKLSLKMAIFIPPQCLFHCVNLAYLLLLLIFLVSLFAFFVIAVKPVSFYSIILFTITICTESRNIHMSP